MLDQRRIQSIDAVRGFAVLGILLMNIGGMGLPALAYLDPTYAGGAEGADFWMWAVNFVVSDGKMRGLFTMLFGASMVLIADRAEGGRLGPYTTHYRRMGWLLLFGLLHAILLWWGDILVCYAIAGSLAFLLHKLSPKTQIAIGACILLVFLAANVVLALQLGALRDAAAAPGAGADVIAAWTNASFGLAPPPGVGAEEIRAMQGGVAEAIGARIANLTFLYPNLLPFEVIEAVGQMLIGMALFRLGFFSLGWSSRAYGAMIAAGYLVAAPVNAWLAWHAASTGFDPVVLNEAGGWSSAPRPFIALAHASVVLLLIRSGGLSWLVDRLAAAGRMALSNYLLTSVITTLIFCGFGFGLFGKLERVNLLYVVVGVWAFMLLWSKPWLERFHYGPFEWVWRSLVQWRLQPWARPRSGQA